MKHTTPFRLLTRLLCLLALMIPAGLASANDATKEPIMHWFEAEDHATNGKAGASDQASNGRYNEGSTWYYLADGIPFPREQESYDVWVRVWSDVPAGWFIQDREAKQVKGHFKTDKAETWTWVRAGRYKAEQVGERFWGIYLGRPIDTSTPSAKGRLDVVVIGQSLTEAILEKKLQERLQAASAPSSASQVQAQQYQDAKRVTYVPYVDDKPVIDGELERDFWDQASLVNDFVLLRASGMATQRTEVKLAAGKEALYISAVLYESQMDFVHQVKTVDGDNVWTDDTFELFIDPQRTDRESHHFIINPAGTVQDNLYRLLDRADGAQQQQTPWVSAVKKHADRWVVELALPWAVLGTPRPTAGQTWAVNFARAERPANELSYWNNTGSYFNHPNRFGLMVFGRFPAELSTIAFDETSRTLQFQLQAHQPQAGKQQVALQWKADAQKPTPSPQEATLDWAAGQQAARGSFSLKDLEPGRYHARLQVRNPSGVDQTLDLPLTLYSDSLVSVAWPPEMRQNLLHMASGTAQHCFIVLGNHRSAPVENAKLVVDVPHWLRMLDPRGGLLVNPHRYFGVTQWVEQAITIEDQPYRRYEMTIDRPIPVGHLESRLFYQSILIFLEEQPGEAQPESKQGQVYYALHSPLGQEQANTFTVKMVPAISGKQPKDLVIHNWLWTLNTNKPIWSPLIRTLQQAGFNYMDAVSGTLDESYVDVLRQADMRTVNNMYWYWWYPEYAQKHPQDIAVDYDGKKVADRKICPTLLMADDGKLAREALAPIVARTRGGLADGVVWNLEGPAAWDVCFCPRCIDAFKQYAGIAPSQSLTPRQIRTSHSRAWVDFACRQNEAMIRILREEMTKVKPGSWVSIYSGNPNPATKERYRVDWEHAAKHLSATFMSYYSHSPSSLNHTFNTAMREMIAQVRGWADDPNFRAIATLTPGYVRNDPLQPTPELMAMQVIRSIASGADGVSFWWWGPFDGLYYAALAEATTTLASVEPFFVQGQFDEQASRKVQQSSGNASVAVYRWNDQALVLLMNHDALQNQQFDLTSFLKDHPGHSLQQMPQDQPTTQTRLTIAPLKWQALIVMPTSKR